jgi:hypothetical protein
VPLKRGYSIKSPIKINTRSNFVLFLLFNSEDIQPDLPKTVNLCEAIYNNIYMTKIINFLYIQKMCIGTLLGDAHIGRNLTGSYITYEQALAKRGYLEHLYSMVKAAGLDMNEPVQYSREDKRYPGTITYSLYFRTVTHPAFDELSDLFLDSYGNKVIPANIADYLDITVLAYWICDDGQIVKNGGVTLCTDSFSSSEIQILRDALESVFGIKTTLHRNGSRIYIGKKSLMKLQPLLRKHVHKSMLRKIHL